MHTSGIGALKGVDKRRETISYKKLQVDSRATTRSEVAQISDAEIRAEMEKIMATFGPAPEAAPTSLDSAVPGPTPGEYKIVE
jgi:hypothetical protein